MYSSANVSSHFAAAKHLGRGYFVASDHIIRGKMILHNDLQVNTTVIATALSFRFCSFCSLVSFLCYSCRVTLSVGFMSELAIFASKMYARYGSREL